MTHLAISTLRVPKRLNSEGQQIGVHNHLGLQMGEQVNILGQGQNFGWGGDILVGADFFGRRCELLDGGKIMSGG